MNKLFVFLFSLSILSCSGGISVSQLIDEQISLVNSFTPNIELGIKKSDFVALANSAGIKFEGEFYKRPDSYIKDGKTYNIYFLRTDRQPDGLKTDDEFTPYIFEKDTLIAIGWSYLGGPKTGGQARDVQTIIIN